jgi:phosphatidylglycerol:prolipoprotein diacylglycerol transferase
MRPELFRIPLPDWVGIDHLPIYGYGLMIVIGFLLGAQLMKYLARRHGFDGELFVNAALIGLLAGVLGARLSHVLENWSAFTNPKNDASTNFKSMLNVSSGGLTFYGGFLFATPVLILYALWKKVPILRGMDIVAPCVMLGLAFGRVGCFLNGCCHGDQCNLPWAVQFPYQSNAYIEHFEKDSHAERTGPGAINPPESLRTDRFDRHGVPVLRTKEEIRNPKAAAKPLRDAGYLEEASRLERLTPEDRKRMENDAGAQRSHPVHPAQLYSAFNALFITGLLVAFLTLAPAPGRVFALMLMLKGVSRFVLEMLRVEPKVWGNLSYSMVISIFLVAAGIGMWAGCGWLARRRAPSPPST